MRSDCPLFEKKERAHSLLHQNSIPSFHFFHLPLLKPSTRLSSCWDLFMEFHSCGSHKKRYIKIQFRIILRFSGFPLERLCLSQILIALFANSLLLFSFDKETSLIKLIWTLIFLKSESLQSSRPSEGRRRT